MKRDENSDGGNITEYNGNKAVSFYSLHLFFYIMRDNLINN